MSRSLKRLEWYSADDPSTQALGLSPVNDAIRITARKGTDIKNNIMTVLLKNAYARYVDDTGNIKFQEEDVLKLYLKQTDDGNDITTDWHTSSNLVGIYFLEEFKHITTPSQHRIELSAVDKAYVLFNKVFTKTYGVESNDYWTAPGIIRSVCRINSSTQDTNNSALGTDNDSGVYFSVNARFVSEGGQITDYRSDVSTALDGAITDSDTTITVDDTSSFKDSGTIVVGTEHIYYSGKTATTFTGCVRGIDDTAAEAASDNDTVYQGFPIVDITKIWKPLNEWFGDLSQTQSTNYTDEIGDGNTLNYNRAFVLWIDKNNEMHWIPADDTVDTTFTVGTDKLYEVSLEKSVFDSVNMVIFNVGEDMYGAGTIWYYFNENSDVASLKMRYQPMTELIDALLTKEYEVNSANYPAATAGDSNRRFPSSYAGLTPTFLNDANSWETQVLGESASSAPNNDSDFNTLLRYAAQWRGRNEAIAITNRLSGLRYRGTITLQGQLSNPGDVVSITDANTGLKTQKVRVIDVTQTFSTGQWSTTLTVEEDEKVLT